MIRPVQQKWTNLADRTAHPKRTKPLIKVSKLRIFPQKARPQLTGCHQVATVKRSLLTDETDASEPSALVFREIFDLQRVALDDNPGMLARDRRVFGVEQAAARPSLKELLLCDTARGELTIPERGHARRRPVDVVR